MFGLMSCYLLHIVSFIKLVLKSLSVLKSSPYVKSIIILKKYGLCWAQISARSPISNRVWYLSGENTLQFDTTANETKLSQSASLIYASLDF